METTCDTHIHVLNNFQVLIPISGDADAFVFTQTTDPSFGLTLTRVDTRESFHYQIQMIQSTGGSEEIISNGLVWAKRTPYHFQKRANTSLIEALICTVKITSGIFDFRRNKERAVRFIVRCFSNDVLLSTGLSQTCKVLPKKRLADEESENNVTIPICWLLDAQDQNRSSEPNYQFNAPEQFFSSPEQYPDEDSVMANFNDSEERLHSFSNEADSDELSLVPTSEASFILTEPEQQVVNDQSDRYMVLYNGNAEVIGNFRALNFYKASDINIKEDVRLLIDDHDPRSVLLKIDGVEYKFKQGATNAPMNKRFVGYIAQQIESVVPEAVQLIDDILHVDYESLIPYLSESIKQNFRDISDMKADASQIHKIVDMMYAEFIKKEQKKNEAKTAGTKDRPRNRSLRWIISASITALVLASIAIGVLFIVPLVHPATSSNESPSPNTPNTPATIESPSINPPNPPPSEPPVQVFPSTDQYLLVEFYYATRGKDWNTKYKASPSVSVCEWPGVKCDADFRVVSLQFVQGDLVGTIPDSIGKLNKLTTLRLRANKLSGTIPASIGNLTSLVELDLGLSEFTGSVPLEIFSLTSLKIFDVISNYNMSWMIPPQISNLKQLKRFNARLSGLHGTLPNEISQLTNLGWLSLGSNNLTGTVPSLANLNLNYLSLTRNHFTGPIPKLNEPAEHQPFSVDLDDNFFSGEVDLPLEIFNDKNYVGLANNKFTSVSPRLDNVTTIAKCFAAGNPFKCPIPEWLKIECQATCT